MKGKGHEAIATFVAFALRGECPLRSRPCSAILTLVPLRAAGGGPPDSGIRYDTQ
jgi:hypothetical protein